MHIDVDGHNNQVAGRDLIILQQRCELAERLLSLKLDPARSAPCVVCGWTCALSAVACPCCGADHKIERSRLQLARIGRLVPAMTITALLLAAVGVFLTGHGLVRVQAGLPVSALAFPGAPIFATLSLSWVAAMWFLHWRHLHSK